MSHHHSRPILPPEFVDARRPCRCRWSRSGFRSEEFRAVAVRALGAWGRLCASGHFEAAGSGPGPDVDVDELGDARNYPDG